MIYSSEQAAYQENNLANKNPSSNLTYKMNMLSQSEWLCIVSKTVIINPKESDA